MSETADHRLNGTWRVLDAKGLDLSELRELSLYFDGTHLYGVAPCKTFTTSLSFGPEHDEFMLAPLNRTPHTCDEETMVLERSYLDVISTLNGFRIEASGRLVLSSFGKDRVTAEKSD